MDVWSPSTPLSGVGVAMKSQVAVLRLVTMGVARAKEAMETRMRKVLENIVCMSDWMVGEWVVELGCLDDYLDAEE